MILAAKGSQNEFFLLTLWRKKNLNMKRFFVSMAMVVAAISISAIPAKRGIWRTVTLEDGTQVKVELRGDENMHFWRAEDGRCFTRENDGSYQLTDLNTLREQANENRRRLAPANGPRRAHYASTADGLGEYGKSGMGSVKSIGEVVIPVILVEFADSAFRPENTIEKMERYFNEPGYADEPGCVGSARDYFISQSYGMFKPSFPVVAKVQVSKNYAYYGGNNAQKNDKNVIGMVREAVKQAVMQGIDFSEYYVNGSVPLVSFIYAGLGEASGGDENTIWPHQLDLTDYYQSMSGFKIKSYFVGNELSYYGGLDGIGTFCHEFGHGLGLPDFYCTNYSYENDAPFGNWSIMESGSNINQGRAPIGYTAYERSYLGWLNIPEMPEEAAAITLGDPEIEDSNYAIMFKKPKSNTEYYILENRQPGTWFPSTFGSGLMVTKFTYNRDLWAQNVLNNIQTSKRAFVQTADGMKLNYSAEMSNLYGNGVTDINTWQWFDTSVSEDIPIYKIMKHSDRSITFNLKERVLPDMYKPTEGTTYTKVTDISQLHKEDTVVIVSESDLIGCGKESTKTGRSGVSINVLDEGNKVLAESNVQEFVLLQTATGEWGLKCGTNYLSASNSGEGLRLAAKPDANAMADISFTEEGHAVIQFVGKNKNNLIRYNEDGTFFCCYASETTGDNIQIYKKGGIPSGINTVTLDKNQHAEGIYTLTGQKVQGNLTKGVYIINGKKTIIK